MREPVGGGRDYRGGGGIVAGDVRADTGGGASGRDKGGDRDTGRSTAE
jgi:hypothetical protein